MVYHHLAICYPSAPLVFLVVKDCGPRSLQQDGALQSVTTAPAGELAKLLAGESITAPPSPLEGKRSPGEEPCPGLWLTYLITVFQAVPPGSD